jgi:SpoVK/Ycf46/Vps4 family AAA+-type ATPase
MVKYINEHKELLNKGINLGKYIAKAWINTYEDLISQLQQPEPPIEPLEVKKDADDRGHLGFGDLFAPKETEETKNLGTVKTKTPNELSGFERIGGQSKAIEQLKRAVIFPRRFPQLYIGRNLEKGAILYGPPGTGKSLMATAFAEEYGAYFVKIAATEMQNKYVGQTEQNWRNLFEDLKANQPALLFIDEIDALCKKRGSGDIHGDKELNQFLKLVSDIKAENLDVFILGATNNYEALDPAVLREGRFGLHIEMRPPQTLTDVEEIFNIHSKNIKLDENVKSEKQAIFRTILDLGLTGAGIEALINKAFDNAFERLGLFEKMDNNTVTEEDTENFSIKAEDFFAELENQKKQKQAPKNRKIGFTQ